MSQDHELQVILISGEFCPPCKRFKESGWIQVLEFVKSKQLADRVETTLHELERDFKTITPPLPSALEEYKVKHVPNIIILDRHGIFEEYPMSPLTDPLTESMTPQDINVHRADWVIGKINEKLKLEE